MKPTTESMQGAGGIQLHSRSWLPETAPRAVVVIVHGVTEHCGRYAHVAAHLVSEQFAVVGFDLRGHGRSGGRRGHLDRWQDYTSDLELVLREVRARFAAVPLFLFGHSLGSLIVLSYVLGAPSGIRGVVVCGAAIEPVGIARPHLVALARALSRIWPTFSIAIPKDGKPKISRDPQVEAEFQQDPLRNTSITARFGTEALAMIAAVKAGARSFALPLLALHGGADPLNSLAGAEWFLGEIASTDKRIIVYSGSYHEPHNDLDRDKLLADLSRWIGDHL